MANNSESRRKAARDLMKMSSAELNEYAVGRSANNSFRQALVTGERARRASVWARWSAIAAIVSVAISAAAWLFPRH